MASSVSFDLLSGDDSQPATAGNDDWKSTLQKGKRREPPVSLLLLNGEDTMFSPPTTARKELSSSIELTAEQQAVLDAANAGHSFFFTGSAGVGKSMVTNILIKRLRAKYGERQVVVAASTGIAATHIGGTTLHSFGGFGIDFSDMNVMLKKASKSAGRQWRETRVLLIDEISMVDARFFSALDQVGRKLRNCAGKAFGGIQVIVTGDFMQLPPVKQEEGERLFECAAWRATIGSRVFLLNTVHRQKNLEFVHLLQRVRMGELSDEDDVLLQSRLKAPLTDNGILPTVVYTHKANVEVENSRNLEALLTPIHKFEATDSGKDDYAKQKMAETCMAPTTLLLKEGAQVMLLQNLSPPTLVNGSRGVVVGFDEETDLPMVRFENGIVQRISHNVWQNKKGDAVLAQRKQIPLCLAWALTVHKCQGMTLDKVRLDISKCFAEGQAYVALSRCTTLEGISLMGYDRRRIKVDERAVKFYASLGDAKALAKKEDLEKRAREEEERLLKKQKLIESEEKSSASKQGQWWKEYE